jgi:serine/threonine-protein kinase
VDPWQRVRQRLDAAVRGEFTIDREIGRGGMAAVFLARDVALDRRVAVKVMASGLLTGRGMVERFAREAVTVARLHHPNIVSIYTVRHLDDLHFFVMQFVDGRSLRQVLHVSSRLPIEAARAILYQIGTALAFAHRRGVIHRDVKPANILLDIDGNAVVMDFGIAKAPERAPAGAGPVRPAGADRGARPVSRLRGGGARADRRGVADPGDRDLIDPHRPQNVYSKPSIHPTLGCRPP